MAQLLEEDEAQYAALSPQHAGVMRALLRVLDGTDDVESQLQWGMPDAMPGRHKSTLLMVQARERKDSGANAAEVAALAREALAIRRRIFRPPDETGVAADLVAAEGERPSSAPKSGVVILT